jgi:hypothetical protein
VRQGAEEVLRMVLAPVNVHEMFYALFRCAAGTAAIAQIGDKTRVTHCHAAKFGPRQASIAQKNFDVSKQQFVLLSAD